MICIFKHFSFISNTINKDEYNPHEPQLFEVHNKLLKTQIGAEKGHNLRTAIPVSSEKHQRGS